MLFMIAYYRLPGLMASLALIFYATLTLAICKLVPITLSLGSIGGIIVSMGIAVDAEANPVPILQDAGAAVTSAVVYVKRYLRDPTPGVARFPADCHKFPAPVSTEVTTPAAIVT